MNLILLLLGLGLDIAKKKLGGEAGEYVGDAEGTLKLVQVALQIHAEQVGLPIDQVIASLKPYIPIGVPPTSPT
jgi:hypothetical protein